MARGLVGWIVFSTLACAGAGPPGADPEPAGGPAPPSPAPAPVRDRPWAAFEGEWDRTDLVDGRAVLLQTCEPRTYHWLVGDAVSVEWAHGEGDAYPITGSHMDGDWLVLDTRSRNEAQSFRIRRDGEALVWDEPVGQTAVRRGTALPRFKECCTDDEPFGAFTGEVVPDGTACKTDGG